MFVATWHATYLLLLSKEELVRVHAIRDGATNHRKQVKDDGGFIGVLEQELLQNIENNREDEE